MNTDRALMWTTRIVLGLVVVALLVALYGLAGCRSISEAVDGKATVNKSTILLGVGAAATVPALLPGWIGALAGAAVGIAITWLSATASDQQAVAGAVQAPWYFDPMQYVHAALTWLAIAVGLGLLFQRSRSQTLQFLKEALTGHPIVGARRFLAAMGWLHSDPIPDKAKG